MQWLSPSYPIGAFNFSQGLEYAVSKVWICDENGFTEWLKDNLEGGYLRNDAIFVKLAFCITSKENLDSLIEFSNAFSCSKSKLEEQSLMGKAFFKVTPFAKEAPFPIAIGLAAKKYELQLESFLPLFVHSSVANLISVAQRLLPIGQSRGAEILREMFENIDQVAKSALHATQEDILSSCYIADSCSMCHETLDGRIFKS